MTEVTSEISVQSPMEQLRNATRIARFDLEAMASVSKDRRALAYGAVILAVGAVVTYASTLLLSGGLRDQPPAALLSLIIAGAVVAVVAELLRSLISLAVFHGLAKVIFGATGNYLGLLRVLWLGSVVLWIGVLPVIGPLIASVWFFLITLVAFEEIDGVERLQALALVIGFAAVGYAITVMLA